MRYWIAVLCTLPLLVLGCFLLGLAPHYGPGDWSPAHINWWHVLGTICILSTGQIVGYCWRMDDEE